MIHMGNQWKIVITYMSGWRTAWQSTPKRSYFMKAKGSTRAIHPTCSSMKSCETSEAQKAEGWTSNGPFKSRHQSSAIHRSREVGAWPQVLHPVCATNNRGASPPPNYWVLKMVQNHHIKVLHYHPTSLQRLLQWGIIPGDAVLVTPPSFVLTQQ